MPYAVRAGEGESFDVINSETDDIKATHQPPDAKEKAERQVRLLNEIEKDPEWEREED